MILDQITPLRNALRDLSSIVWLLVETAQETVEHVLQGRPPFRLSAFFEQTDRAGVGSLPLVSLVSFFLGLTMALLTGYQLRTFGTERLVPGLVAVGFTRELGPLLTGIMLAARVGAAYTAELGTMTVAEEVEAIEAMGIGPLRFLVSPPRAGRGPAHALPGGGGKYRRALRRDDRLQLAAQYFARLIFSSS